jgi:hypothetical protein
MLETVVEAETQKTQEKSEGEELDKCAKEVALSLVDSWELRMYSPSQYLLEETKGLEKLKWCVSERLGYDIGEVNAVNLFMKYCLDEFRRKHLIVSEEGVLYPIKQEKIKPEPIEEACSMIYEQSTLTLQLGSRINDSIIYLYNGQPTHGVLISTPNKYDAAAVFDKLKDNPHIMTFLQTNHSGEILNLKEEEKLFKILVDL